MTQSIIVYLILAASVSYLGYRIYSGIKKKHACDKCALMDAAKKSAEELIPSFMNSLIFKLNRWGYLIEQKTSVLFLGLLIGVSLLAMAMVYVAPDFEPAYHGANYSALSLHPFDLSAHNPLQFRILAPLLGYLTFLKGDLFLILPYIFSILLLAAIYIHYRKINFNFLESIIMSAIIAFSSTLFVSLEAPGYTDTIIYFFLFLSFVFVQSPVKSSLFFGLALLTHEYSIFLLPGIIAYKNYSNNKNIFSFNKTIFFYLVACIPYILYRFYITSQTLVEYDWGFYFSSATIHLKLGRILPLIIPGLFFAFKLFWVYPLWIIGKKLKSKHYSFIIVILIIILSVMSQLIIAYDVTRVLCLMFPAVLLCAQQLKMEMKENQFVKLGFLIMLLNFGIAEYCATDSGFVRLFHIPFR